MITFDVQHGTFFESIKYLNTIPMYGDEDALILL